MSKKRKHHGNTVVIPGKGSPCPRCGNATQIRGHARIGPRELKRPFFYCRWFYCTNKGCKTSLIMPDEFRVFTMDLEPGIERRLAAISEQLGDRQPAELHNRPPWEE